MLEGARDALMVVNAISESLWVPLMVVNAISGEFVGAADVVNAISRRFVCGDQLVFVKLYM